VSEIAKLGSGLVILLDPCALVSQEQIAA